MALDPTLTIQPILLWAKLINHSVLVFSSYRKIVTFVPHGVVGVQLLSRV